jgi:hypothetical protein
MCTKFDSIFSTQKKRCGSDNLLKESRQKLFIC